MATKQEIATKVLQKLSVLEANETTVIGNDKTLVEEKYDSVYQMLKAKDLVNWGSTEDIPTQAVVPITGLVALECLEEYNVPMRVAQSIMVNEQRYLRQLKEFEYQYYRPDEEEAYYF